MTPQIKAALFSLFVADEPNKKKPLQYDLIRVFVLNLLETSVMETRDHFKTMDSNAYHMCVKNECKFYNINVN